MGGQAGGWDGGESTGGLHVSVPWFPRMNE